MKHLVATVLLVLPALTNGLNVYLFPTPEYSSKNQPLTQLARHLNLRDSYHNLDSLVNVEQEFVGRGGQGRKSALVITLESEHVQELLPETTPSLAISTLTSNTLTALLYSYLSSASHTYSHLTSPAPSPDHPLSYTAAGVLTGTEFNKPPKGYLASLQSFDSFLESAKGDEPCFGVVDLTSLPSLQSRDEDHDEAEMAMAVAYAALESALALVEDGKLNLAVLAYSPRPTTAPSGTALVRRGVQQEEDASKASQVPFPLPTSAPPQEPIGAVSACFASLNACITHTSANSSSSREQDACSGHGSCVQATKAGRTCFVCACGETVGNKGKREGWAGERCERKDVSAPFTLITGVTIVLLILIYGSVSLLSTVGDEALPGTLMGGAVPGAKRD